MFLAPMLASTTPDNKRPKVTAANGYVLEPKHDGMRAVISKHDHEVKIYSRVGLGYELHLPSLVSQFASVPNGTVLDGELMVVKSRVDLDGHEVAVADFNQTMRIMGSGHEKAIVRQNDHTIEFCTFDLPKLDDKSLTDQPYSTRMQLLDLFLSANNMPHVFRNVALDEWDDSHIDRLWEYGIEGAILKKTDSLYVPGKRRANTWYKIKAELTADVVVTGFTEAKEGKTGKFLGKIGAITFGAYDSEGYLSEIGQCSGMDDAERDRWTAIRDSGEDYTQRVIEVKYNDLVGSGTFGTPRHPQFKTERIDKRPEDCLMDQFKM